MRCVELQIAALPVPLGDNTIGVQPPALDRQRPTRLDDRLLARDEREHIAVWAIGCGEGIQAGCERRTPDGRAAVDVLDFHSLGGLDEDLLGCLRNLDDDGADDNQGGRESARPTNLESEYLPAEPHLGRRGFAVPAGSTSSQK